MQTKQIIDRQITALNTLYNVIETEVYKNIVSLCLQTAQSNFSKRIFVAGVGKNANIASKIAESMASLGVPSGYLNISHCGHGDYGFIGHEDVVIHISRSGSTREMLEVMKHLKLIRPNVKQVLVHCKPSKSRNYDADFEICIPGVKEGDEHELAPNTSTTAILCLLDCLTAEVSHKLGFQRLDFLKYHPDGALGEMLKAETEAIKTKDKPEPGMEFA